MAGIDGRTIEGLRRGEDRAFTAVVDLLVGPVYRLLLRLSGDPGVAEDLTQETFLAVWQSIGTFEGKSQFKTWVFGIAYHQFLRYRDRPKTETVQFDEARHARGTADPEVLLLEADDQHRLRQAIRALPDPYREAFCLVHLEGMSYREAAAVLGMPVGTVKSRMNVAFKALREKLAGSEEQSDDVRESESLPRR